jgi:predicted RNase H-like HicB family nuclease
MASGRSSAVSQELIDGVDTLGEAEARQWHARRGSAVLAKRPNHHSRSVHARRQAQGVHAWIGPAFALYGTACCPMNSGHEQAIVAVVFVAFLDYVREFVPTPCRELPRRHGQCRSCLLAAPNGSTQSRQCAAFWLTMRNYTAVVEKDPSTGFFVGHVPGWPGAHSQGATLDELQANLREVVEMLLEDGEPQFESEFVGTANVRVA